MRNLIILRGVPGAGKSTLAELFNKAFICCADDWYTEVLGSYDWSPENGQKAHK